MITKELLTYGLSCLAALTAFGLIMSTSAWRPRSRHRAPRGYQPAPAASITRSPIEVWRVPQIRPEASVAIAPDGPIETPGASLAEGGIGDAVRVPDSVATLDRDPDSPEAWLAAWAVDYRAELQRLAEEGPPPAREPSDIELIRETDRALSAVQRVCLSAAARLTSVAEAGIFDWRISTDTGRLPVIDGPIADRLAESLLSS